jgi:hypothetical protein
MNVRNRIEEVKLAFLCVATLAAGDFPISGSEERQETVEELHDRFKTWLGNIDVLPGGYKRLDERLHHASELRETVTELLQNLSHDLNDGKCFLCRKVLVVATIKDISDLSQLKRLFKLRRMHLLWNTRSQITRSPQTLIHLDSQRD